MNEADLRTKHVKNRKVVISSPSLKRRRSLKAIRDAKLNMMRKIINEKYQYVGDRYMMHRGIMDLDNIDDARNRSFDDNENVDELSVPNLINKTMRPSTKRVLKLTIHHKSPSYEEKLQKLLKNCSNNKHKVTRQISVHPDRVLDAPDVSHEFQNIIDWNRNNVIAVALGPAVYLWDASVRKVEELLKYPNAPYSLITCVKWVNTSANKSDRILAVGITQGTVALWDVVKKQLMTFVTIREGVPTLSIAVKGHLISCGCSTGLIMHHDFFAPAESKILVEHQQSAVRHLMWSSNFHHLAVAYQGNCVSVYHANNLESTTPTIFSEKVCDIAWSPRDEFILLCCLANETGGLKMFDVKTKACIKSVSIGSRISSMFWSGVVDEVAVTSEDRNDYRIKLLDDSSLRVLVELIGHRDKIVAIKASPTGEMLATIGLDEQIRLWSCFQNYQIYKSKRDRDRKSSTLKDLLRFR